MGKITNVGSEKDNVTTFKIYNKMGKTDEVKIHNIKQKKLKNLNYYISDPCIIPRVEEYLSENKEKVNIDVDDIVDDLRKNYREYSRKKRGPFKAIIEKAFSIILKKHKTSSGNFSDDTEGEGGGDIEDFDEEDGDEVEDIDEEEEEEDDEEVSGMEDEEDDEEDDDDLYGNISPERPSRVKRPMIMSMYGNDSKKSSQRNGTQELINISSDESEKEASAKNESPAKSKSNSEKISVIATRHPTSPRFPSQANGNGSAQEGNTRSFGPGYQSRQDTAMITKSKLASALVGRIQQHSGAQHTLEFPIKTRTCVKFCDVGGCSKILKEITQLLVHLRHPEVYQYLGVTPPRGFLLHGPPGTGKTLLARAIAGELKLPLIQVAAPELIRGVSGSSEERIRHLFEQAVSIAPCILFLDEVDAITPRRDTAQREMERRIVAQLLASLDELNTTQNGNKVLVIGATNRPDAIDPALRRSGRFDREVCLGIPSREARKEIIGLLTTKLRISPNVSLDNIALQTPGYVGADLKALVTEAAIAAVERLFGEDNITKDKQDVSTSTNEQNTKDTEMKDLTKEDSESNETGKKELVDDIGEPKRKKRKTEEESTNSESNKEIEVLPPEEAGDKVVNIDDSITESNKTVETVGNSESSNAISESGNNKKDDQATVNSESATKGDDLDVINVEDEESEMNKNNANKPEPIKISSLIHSFNPLSLAQLKSLLVEECDFNTALKVVQPSAKREGFATVPDVTWDDIGSLKDIRHELQMTIMAPVKYPEEFARLGLSASSGVLLCGPPGCGKTLLAKAIANEAGINFISVKGPELLNMYVGESERAVRQCFLRARNSQPCVIFFDELDALCPKRSDTSEGGASMRVVNQMLTEMDGVESRNGVFVMAASNRPDIIDPAVLRPGRLDKILFVGLPSPSDRVDILKAITKNGTRPLLQEDVFLDEIGQSELCNGYTGADLSSLVREAGIESLKEFMKSGGTGTIGVAGRHFNAALNKIRPSVSEEDQKHYEKLRSQYSVISPYGSMEVSE